MKYAALLLIFLAGCSDAPARDISVIQGTAVRLEFEKNGVCSGTAVGRDLVLTAEHCFEGERLVRINGKEAYALRMVKDGKDHVLVKVSMTFKSWAPMGKAPKQGDKVRWIGNPAGEPNVYREGYVSRVEKNSVLVDAQVWKGDSGAGLFNDKGEVIGVVSAMVGASSSFVLAYAYPLEFTAKQWREAGV